MKDLIRARARLLRSVYGYGGRASYRLAILDWTSNYRNGRPGLFVMGVGEKYLAKDYGAGYFPHSITIEYVTE